MAQSATHIRACRTSTVRTMNILKKIILPAALLLLAHSASALDRTNETFKISSSPPT